MVCQVIYHGTVSLISHPTGATLIYDTITEPHVSPRVRPLAAKMNNVIQYIYQTFVNAVVRGLVQFVSKL